MSERTHDEVEPSVWFTSDAVTAIVPAAGRLLIGALFLASGLYKVAAPALTVAYIQSVGLPFPELAFALSTVIELVGGVALVLGYRTRVVAVLLIVFVLATAAFFHRDFADQDQLIHFFKNLAIAGGLLHVIAFGGGRLSVDGRAK